MNGYGQGIEAMPSEWQQRERYRFENGAYADLPWKLEDWWQTSAVQFTHYAHVSASDPSKLAYTIDYGKGISDLQQKMKPGKYLRKYFGEGREYFDVALMEWKRSRIKLPAILSEVEISQWSSRYAALHESNPIQFAITAEDIKTVYTTGPRSCMANKQQSIDGVNREVVESYSYGDVAVAWLKKPDGGIRARSVVNLKSKLYNSVYGDPPRLIAALHEQGYKHSHRALNGCRLHAWKIDGDNAYMVPWLDGEQNIGLSECETHFTIGGGRGDIGSFNASSTCGSVGCGEVCGRCEDHFPADRGVWIESIGEMWCGGCAEDTFWCEHCDQRNPDDNYGGSVSECSWCQSCLEDDATHCEKCEEYYADDDTNNVEGTSMCYDCSATHAFVCDRCGDWKHDENRRQILTGEGSKQTISDWCEGCSEDGAIACGATDCDYRVDLRSTAENDAGDEYCSDCIDAHRSTRERLSVDWNCAQALFLKRRAARSTNYYPPKWPIRVWVPPPNARRE